MDQETMAWVKKQAEKLAKRSTDDQERALLLAVIKTVEEQGHRLELAAGELDGRAWGGKRI